MGLHRVPGSKVYKADDAGLAALGTFSSIGAATLAAAQEVARLAEAAGQGAYGASPATVTAGWSNERRAGAMVKETYREYKDSRDAILLRVVQSMAIDTPGSDSDMVTYTRKDGTTRRATRAQAANWSRGRA